MYVREKTLSNTRLLLVLCPVPVHHLGLVFSWNSQWLQQREASRAAIYSTWLSINQIHGHSRNWSTLYEVPEKLSVEMMGVLGSLKTVIVAEVGKLISHMASVTRTLFFCQSLYPPRCYCFARRLAPQLLHSQLISFVFGAPSLQLPEILPSRCPVLSAPPEQ